MLETVPRRVLKGDLDNILGKALKKIPAERYVSATDFADDLKRLLGHEPVRAHADTVRYRVVKFVRRHRGSVVGAVLTAIGMIATTGFAVRQMLEARAQRDLANFEAAESSAHSELTEFLLGDSLGLAPHDVAATRLERARVMIHQRFADNPLVQARMLINLSGRYIDLGDTRGSAALMREAEAIAQKLDDPNLNADIGCGRAQDAVDAGDLATAHAHNDRGRANMRRLRVVPSGLVAECAMSTAYIAQAEGEYPLAVAVTADAMRKLESEGLQRSSRYTSIAHEHARSLVQAGDYRNGFAAEQAVMSIVTAVGRDSSAAYFAMLNVAASALVNGGQPRRAIALLESNAARVRSSVPDAELPFYLAGTELLAERAAGITATADSGLMQYSALAERQQLGGMVVRYRIGAIRAALERGDTAAAERYWPTISAMETKRADAAERRDALRVLIVHAALDLARHDPAAAGEHLGQATALIPGALRAADPEWRELLLTRLQLEYALAQYPAAATDADSAVAQARREAIDPGSSEWIGEALVWRANIEHVQGRRDAAAASAKEAILQLRQNVDPRHVLSAHARALAAAG